MHNKARENAYGLLLKRKQYKKLTLDDLYEIVTEKGFEIIEYKKYNNSLELKTLINSLHLEKDIQESNCFLYYNENLKLLFINQDVPDEDKITLLSHEVGHIYDDHFLDSEIKYSKVKRENFANEFSHYLTKPFFAVKSFAFILKKPLFCLIIFMILTFAGFTSSNALDLFEQNPAPNVSSDNAAENVFYVTASGKKYHRGFCKHVKNRTNIKAFYSSEDVTAEGYEPCLDCIGDGNSI